MGSKSRGNCILFELAGVRVNLVRDSWALLYTKELEKTVAKAFKLQSISILAITKAKKTITSFCELVGDC